VAQLESWEFVEMEVGRTVAVDDPAGAFSVTAYDANHCPGNLFVSNCSSSVEVMTVRFISTEHISM
jgi:Cft2 family RNA processing exonuclease